MERFISPKIFDPERITAAVSTRKGGVSTGYFSTLNLGKSTSDAPENIAENRRRFFSALEIDEAQTALSYQVHGCEILHTENPCRENGYDALMTDKKGLFLVVSAADCTPVLMHDERNNAVAAIHAGWRGAVGNIVPKTIARMKQVFGTDPRELKIFVGPCIGVGHFEIGEEVAREFPLQFVHKSEVPGKFFGDLKGLIRFQAISSGITENHLEISEYCTFREESLFFSHRRDKGNTGRMLAVIGMK